MTASAKTVELTNHKPRAARITTILLVARVSTETRDDLCRVRNISVSGMRIETLAPVAVGQEIDVELKNGVTVRAEVMWVRATEAGVRFEVPVSIAKILAPATMPDHIAPGKIMRSPRLSAQCPAVLRHDGRVLNSHLINISQGGAQVRLSEPIKLDEDVVLSIPGLAPRRAVVRWVKDETLGLGFIEKLGFTELAQWLAGPERFGQLPTNGVSSIPQSS